MSAAPDFFALGRGTFAVDFAADFFASSAFDFDRGVLVPLLADCRDLVFDFDRYDLVSSAALPACDFDFDLDCLAAALLDSSVAAALLFEAALEAG